MNTGQGICYDATGPSSCPGGGESFFGQDSQYYGFAYQSFTAYADGTVDDMESGLSWARYSSFEASNQTDAAAYCAGLEPALVIAIKRLPVAVEGFFVFYLVYLSVLL